MAALNRRRIMDQATMEAPAPKGTIQEPTWFCPECRSAFPASSEAAKATHFVCNRCAAIAMIDPKQGLRLLRTQEWLDVMSGPAFHGLFDSRTAVLEALTRPPG